MTDLAEPTITRLKAAVLIFDYAVYPRSDLDTSNMSRLRAARDAGIAFAPVVADRASRRIVDGFHRVRLVLEADPEGDIDVELRDYADDDELLLDAARRNAVHGARLTSWDVSHCLALATERGIALAHMAAALSITADKAEQIRRSRTAYDPNGKPVQIKRSAGHLAGKKLTPTQVDANERASGWSVRFHCDQIINALDGGLLDQNDPGEIDALRRLAEVLERHLP
jgi:hypothetical protein